MINIVLGTGFGDEGKGQAVHSLSHPKALVVRFSGGHQCGHTVTTKTGLRHIFAQFGAGTFQGSATYISQHCTVFPVAFMNEYRKLQSPDINLHFDKEHTSGTGLPIESIEPDTSLTARLTPSLRSNRPVYYVNPLAMLTTPYDLAFNRALSMITGYGTCGVGFGTTLQRNDDFYNLYVNDIQIPYIFETKMSFIKKYYEEKIKAMNMSSQVVYEDELDIAWEGWEESLNFYREFITIKALGEIISQYDDFVFEGSQGILLDQHFGFFPHVTRSNTTSQNAIEIINNSVLKNQEINTFYVSRCYQTRHGNGPFSCSGVEQYPQNESQYDKKPENNILELINNSLESNRENDWQGVFRIAPLDFSLIRHAVGCDSIYNPNGKKHLILTCLDHLIDMTEFDKNLEKSGLKNIFTTVLKKKCIDWL